MIVNVYSVIKIINRYLYSHYRGIEHSTGYDVGIS